MFVDLSYEFGVYRVLINTHFDVVIRRFSMHLCPIILRDRYCLFFFTKHRQTVLFRCRSV